MRDSCLLDFLKFSIHWATVPDSNLPKSFSLFIYSLYICDIFVGQQNAQQLFYFPTFFLFSLNFQTIVAFFFRKFRFRICYNVCSNKLRYLNKCLKWFASFLSPFIIWSVFLIKILLNMLIRLFSWNVRKIMFVWIGLKKYIYQIVKILSCWSLFLITHFTKNTK